VLKVSTLTYSGKEKEAKIYLYKNGNHFDVINSMQAFLVSCYYCYKCDKPYGNKNKHRCSTRVRVCKLCRKPQHSEKEKIYCQKCNRHCFNQDCFNNHHDVCKKVYKCRVCNKIKLRAETHVCGYSLCRNFKKIVETDTYKCYMQPKLPKPRTEKYIFFYYEAEQDSGVHKPNLVVAHYFDGTKFYFKTNEEFCEWLISPKHKSYTAIAHNAKGYDSQFILKYCVDNTLRP